MWIQEALEDFKAHLKAELGLRINKQGFRCLYC